MQIGGWPQMDQWLSKVGETTGWTSGPVTSTCINAPVASNKYLLCQQQFNPQKRSLGGDSGAPVFSQENLQSNDVVLYGSLVGEMGVSTVMTNMAQITFELGPSPVTWQFCASGFGC
ncbi:MAG: hypothetical protein HY681_04955 [Chloroflexi bacterium]|nr:hypothetical protein [Chloroflexota bacterium]